jgi:rhamnosyltransferase
VLLATFNGERWLPEQLRSIFDQEGVDVSVVVSDHGSTDGTLSLLQQWQERGAQLEVLPDAPTGRGAAMNFLRLIRDERRSDVAFIALADQDDIWLPQRLRRAIDVLRLRGAAAYSSDALAYWPNGRNVRLGKSYAQRRYDYLLEAAGPGCTYVMTVEFVQALRAELTRDPHRFDATSYHDWLIYAYARTHGFRWVIDDYVGVCYRQHADNDVGANVGLGGIRRRWQRSKSGLYRRQVLHMGRLWPAEHAQLLERFERFSTVDRLSLALGALQLRRRPRDQLALFSMLLLGALG